MSKFTIQQLATVAGISVRTLHYYDQIGLLKPLRNNENGYRVYDENALVRLQQILFFKELEFSLQSIRAILDSPIYDRKQVLLEQQQLLRMKKERLDGLIKTIDRTISSLKGGVTMNTNDMFDALSDEQIEAYKNEAKQRWGNTQAYQQSVQRSQNWTKADIKRVQQEWGRLLTAVAETMDLSISSPSTQKAIDDIYQHLFTFYDPNLEMFEGLGQMYVDDDRFRKTFEKIKPGLAEYTRDAIKHYVKTHKD